MKKYLLLVLLTMCSCGYTRVRNLTLYDKFKLTKNELRIDGYYYREYTEYYSAEKRKVTYRVPIFLYADGTSANYTSTVFSDYKRLEEYAKTTRWAEWGAYNIVDDSIKIQTLDKVDKSDFPPSYYDVVTWEGIVLNDSTFNITRELRPGVYSSKKKIRPVNMLYMFHRTDTKVDSIHNWTRSELNKRR